MLFEGLEGCVREQKRYQQNIANETNIHPPPPPPPPHTQKQNNAETMLEIVMTNDGKRCEHGSRKDTKIQKHMSKNTKCKTTYQIGTHIAATAGKWEAPFNTDNTKPTALDTESN